ncbi:hypothetical protein EW026_g8242 [Hermanssonia centrifuga]|uniref:Polyprotein n=1 Tax=Hermanssonia centrifuga TaxID=98765 RepID=A0A4S4K5W4_9APHY|nr:hypothetical protein EW026_g8242 [Hermanssonia centrifuga]
MVVNAPYRGKWQRIRLLNVLYSPSFRCTLVSISRFVSRGFGVLIDEEGLHLHTPDNEYLATIPCKNGLYRVDHTAPDSAIAPMAFIIERNKVSLYDAHIRNGHVSYDYIKKALDSDHKYHGLQIDPLKMEEPLCEACIKGKISRTPIRKERISDQAANFGDILHMDLWGPSPVPSAVVKREDGDLDILTSPLDGTILPGVTRDSMLTLIAAHGSKSSLRNIPTSLKLYPHERTFTIGELVQWSEEGRLLEAFTVGRWEGCALNFQVIFAEDSSVVCTATMLERGERHPATRIESYTASGMSGLPLLDWVRQTIDRALAGP